MFCCLVLTASLQKMYHKATAECIITLTDDSQLHKAKRTASWLHITCSTSRWEDICWRLLLKDSQKPHQRIKIVSDFKTFKETCVFFKHLFFTYGLRQVMSLILFSLSKGCIEDIRHLECKVIMDFPFCCMSLFICVEIQRIRSDLNSWYWKALM